MIQKIKLDFTHSVNLWPIIVDIITKKENKIKRCSSGDRTSNLLPENPAFQHTSNILVCHYPIFLFVLLMPFSCLMGPPRFFTTLFENSFLAFKLVLQNYFHGLASTVIRLFSGQCVFLNFVLWLTAILKTLANYPPKIK